MNSLTAFTNNGYQWFQVAELGYDFFMARHSAQLIAEHLPSIAKKPRSERLRGFLLRELARMRYLNFGGSPKSSGGSSICGISILTLLRSTFEGLSSRPVTVIGNAITSTTMIACRPTQGSAPQ